MDVLYSNPVSTMVVPQCEHASQYLRVALFKPYSTHLGRGIGFVDKMIIEVVIIVASCRYNVEVIVWNRKQGIAGLLHCQGVTIICRPHLHNYILHLYRCPPLRMFQRAPDNGLLAK